MAIGVQGRIGVLNAGSSAPATLAAYLDSIGVTWYGGFRRGLNMYAVSTDQNTPVTTFGASVGQWAANWSTGGFSAKFVQTTSSKRPAYASVYGTTGLQGDATTTWLNLDSTTALNRDHTVLISATALADSGAIYSHNSSNMRCSLPAAASGSLGVYAAGSQGMTVQSVVSVTPVNNTTAGYRVGWKSSGSAFYNNAPNLMRLSGGTAYTEACIAEVWLIGALLTPAQVATCLPYMVL